MNYTFYFTKIYTYEIEADNLDEAEEKAHENFEEDVCSLIADTEYNELSVEYEDENGEIIEKPLY